LCKNFIRRYGNVVAITENFEVISIWDDVTIQEYQNSAKEISKLLKNAKIQDVFFETYRELDQNVNYESVNKNLVKFRLGIAENRKIYTKEEAEKFGVVKPEQRITFNHLHLDLPKQFVDQSGKSIESIMADYRSAKEVFKRALEELNVDTLTLVKDLIKQGSLLDGQTHLYKVEQFLPFLIAYNKLNATEKDNYAWTTSYKLPIAKFKNELIGVLCTELAEGKELNDACMAWNKRVDPANYMKAVAPITTRQIEDAKRFVEENGYSESFNRRFATIEDINISEIKHVNVGDGNEKPASIFDSVKPATSTRHKRAEFDKVEEVSIETFMKDILPTCTNIEAFFEAKHAGNLVTLTTANNPASKPIFKYTNNFSKTFNGNLAGKSQIKQEVKSAGGKVDGVLRFSIMWADGNQDNSDLDAHCQEPTGHIYYANRHANSGGNLDIDIQTPNGKLAVENITWPSLRTMKDGKYNFYVNQFANRYSKGFKAEIEFNGEIFSYEYNMPVNGNIAVAAVTLKNGEFAISHALTETSTGSNKEIYGVETNKFQKVNLICLSPNHWATNNSGNKYYMFMIEKCKCDQPIRSFHAEDLLPELAQHRKVLEILGNTTMIQPTEKQLSVL
jgi:hypothetical protein